MTLTRPIYGDVGDPDLMDEYADAIEANQAAVAALQAPTIARLRQTVAQSLTNTVWGAITFTTEDVDTAGAHDTVTNPSRWTCPASGWYWIGGGVGFAANTTGIRGVRFAINGTAVNGSESLAGASPSGSVGNRQPARSMLIQLTAGQYLEMEAFQSSGGALNTSVASTEQPSLDIMFVR